MDPEGVERKLAAILSADAVGYTRLMAEDEVATVRTLGAYRAELGRQVEQHGGRVVDAPGDNLLAEFPSATQAVRCAAASQRELARRNAGLAPDRRMSFRMGVHLGEVVVEGERIYGDGVNVAARLEGEAQPGGVCLSQKLVDEVHGKLPMAFEDLGERSFKNLSQPVRVYRLRVEGGPPLLRPEPPARRLGARVALAALGLVAAVLASWWALSGESPAEAPSRAIRSVAVLPLDNLSGDPEQEYFATGMTEALIGDLARIASLGVVSRTTVMQYAGARKPLTEIAAELGVDAVLEGSVLRAGDRVRISAQLIDARSDRHLWSQSYERDLRDVLALQSEVARAIAAEIQLELAPADRELLAETRPVDPEAYEAYLRGVHFLKKMGAANHGKAVELLERATELDPGYAPAWARLADGYT